jgi:hypothetical protein
MAPAPFPGPLWLERLVAHAVVYRGNPPYISAWQ